MEPEQRPEAAARTLYDGNVAMGNARSHFGDHYAGAHFSRCHFNVTYIGERFTVAASTAPQDIPVVQGHPAGEIRPLKARSRPSVVQDAAPRLAEERDPEIPALASQVIDESGPSPPRLLGVPRARTRRPIRARDDPVTQPAPDAGQGVTASPSLPTVRADYVASSLVLAAAKARGAHSTSKSVDVPSKDDLTEKDGIARNFGTGIYRARYAYSWKSVSGKGYLREGELVLVGVEDGNPNYCTKVTGICDYELGETAWISKRGLLEKATSTKTYATARCDVRVKMEDHLAISKGDIVEVFGKRGRTWLVKLGDAYGIVPASAFEFDVMEFFMGASYATNRAAHRSS